LLEKKRSCKGEKQMNEKLGLDVGTAEKLKLACRKAG